MKRRKTTTGSAIRRGGRASARQRLDFARAVLDALPDHIYVKDLQGRYLLVNEAGVRERKLARPEDIVGKTVYDLVPRELADRMSAEDRSVVESGKALINREDATRFVGVARDGEAPRWHITTKIPMRDARGRVIGVLGINRDITDRKRAEIALRESEETFRAIFDQAAVGITVVSPQLRYVRVNDRYCEMLGYARAELLAMKLADVIPPEGLQPAIDYRRELLAGTAAGHELRERQLLRKDGSRIWAGIATSLVRAEDGTPRYFVSVVEDISEAKRAAIALRESEERFRHLAHYDPLTNLPNRALFADRLNQTLAQAARNRWTVGVMLIDLDRFKQVNDSLGHAAGDLLLNQVAARLTGAVRSGDTVGRLGGDEFAVVLSGVAAPQDAGMVAQKIIACIDDPFLLDASRVSTAVSVGIALYPDDGRGRDELLKKADAAMYQAKSSGRGCYRFYNPAMNARVLQVRSTENDLRQALARGQLVLHYQPKIALASRELAGAEALLRWAHPERGLVVAADFMSALAESALAAEIGAWVLETACRQLGQWRSEGLSAVPVAVNLFPRQFIRRDLASILSRVLGAYRVDPAQLELEVTEAALMADPDETLRALQEMSDLGLRCSVDDFGTGSSSLGALRRFALCALDGVKLEGSFVRELPGNPDGVAVVRAAISLARHLGLRVIAEGVETEAQLDFLTAEGCELGQGFYFSSPLPAAEFRGWLAGERRLHAA